MRVHATVKICRPCFSHKRPGLKQRPSAGRWLAFSGLKRGHRKAGVNETHVCVEACECVNKAGGLVRLVQAASSQQLLAFPADLALNSLNLPAESRNWATRGILGETGKAQRGRGDGGGRKKKGRQADRMREGQMNERSVKKEGGMGERGEEL